ncbi:MAG: DNA repair protein RadC [Proteobacteria bacterium]|jgi:DNA repair protein RadC|nr:DNA repair protein RadC [Pseudomonadota bacterium]
MTITDWPITERPRERLLARGAEGLSDAELVAVLLRTGSGGRDAVRLARDLLGKYRSLGALLDAPTAELTRLPGIGPAKAAALGAAVALAERYLACAVQREEVFGASVDVRRYLRHRLGSSPREIFGALFLDAQHRLIAFREMFQGTLDSATVHPREVLRETLELNAAAVIFVHNHPSGVAEPSSSDVKITERLRHLLQLIDVRVLDHVVVTASEAVSMAERGLL